MNFMYFSINSDIYFKNINFIYNHLFSCNHTCYCVGKVSVTLASRYVHVTPASCYQSRSSVYTQGPIPRNWLRRFRLALMQLHSIRSYYLENLLTLTPCLLVSHADCLKVYKHFGSRSSPTKSRALSRSKLFGILTDEILF